MNNCEHLVPITFLFVFFPFGIEWNQLPESSLFSFLFFFFLVICYCLLLLLLHLLLLHHASTPHLLPSPFLIWHELLAVF